MINVVLSFGGWVLSRYQVVYELEIYFFHFNNPECGSGWPRRTLLGRMGAGDVGGSSSGSSIPHGVDMSDSEYLQLINRVDCALVALKALDLLHGSLLWDYVVEKYGNGCRNAVLMAKFDKSRDTMRLWNNRALLLISERIS